MPGNEGQGPPPGGAQADAAVRKSPGAKQLNPQSVQEIKDELARGRVVAVSVVVYEYCWTTLQIRNTGNVIMPFPGDVSQEGHAICLVGYEDLDGEPDLGGGRFIVRNSWDNYWGVNCDLGAGYGTLPYAYLTTYGTEAYAIGQRTIAEMDYAYLKSLILTDEQEAKLRSLGVRSASALLSPIENTPEKFSAFFGAQEMQRIQQLLPGLIPEEERAQMAQLPAFQGKFGGRIIASPPTEPQQAATDRRDELMNRIKMIRESGASSGKAKALLEDLENELRQGLKATVSGGDQFSSVPSN